MHGSEYFTTGMNASLSYILTIKLIWPPSEVGGFQKGSTVGLLDN